MYLLFFLLLLFLLTHFVVAVNFDGKRKGKKTLALEPAKKTKSSGLTPNVEVLTSGASSERTGDLLKSPRPQFVGTSGPGIRGIPSPVGGGVPVISSIPSSSVSGTQLQATRRRFPEVFVFRA